MKNNKSLISIIVPCYNSELFIRETLNSVICQTYTNWECIIVDNSSTDGSKTIAEEFTKKDSRFISIQQPKRGVSAARNLGIEKSSGKYILPLDADDIIAPTYLQKATKILDENEIIKLVYCEAEFFGEMKGKWNLPDFSIKQMLFENIIFCTSLFRRSDFNNTNGYNEQMITGYEDWDFWLSLLKSDTDTFRIPEILFFYRIRKNSRNNSLNNENLRALRKLLFENHREVYLSNICLSDLIFDYYLAKGIVDNYKLSQEYVWGKRILPFVRVVKKLFFLS